ncbi:bifunctional UDP-sugar hydrolase/5'-nucleotidase [Nocardioides zeae]|uniref:Bifunctional UDP-sugar hydrolase/5'-nucleotidase n=1 Tax=Nocardioides imazamoxiresistens TaxID=3231893 RepID=A0ABU3PZY2_9ACTN|nr:bifunctional UDP-sugar hydrolase/5'-nucleotidase [Nocardioides zeae]MDT9594751.1 bifunctional UDP-sugar hydrolase/5'-nucleotidase [Nocardioides zeae]
MSKNPASRARLGRLAALAVGATLVATPLAITPAQAEPVEAAAPVELQLLNINDFHGALPYQVSDRSPDSALQFATTLEQQRAGKEDNTLVLSAGDNIGASQFVSSAQDDKPTIEVLNALDVAASAVGNHEFDRGFADLSGRVSDLADFPFLGANVYNKGTTTPAMQEYALLEAAGLTVAVVGAVTRETPTLVSPEGVANLDFGNPVAAVNRVAAQLTDGDPENGEADIVIAQYHEGATGSGTLEQELASSAVLRSIVNNTSAEVDAIFTAHTHQTYAWAAPVPGAANKTRPVLQTGNGGANVGKVVLTVDPATNEVTAHTQQNVARGSAIDLNLPRVAAAAEIISAARAFAKPIGDAPVGNVPADITTAYTGGSYIDGVYTGGSRDDRASESTLGNFVATALREGVSEVGGADLGIVNPGGLRAELLFAGDTADNPANTDGVVTYAESNAVVPFANSVFLVDLTGEQLKEVLEQQWQRDAAGNVPSRAFLHLGLSDNVEVNYDPSLPEGSRITGIWIDGEWVDADATYTVSTFSFLAQGGDNFRAFRQGTSTDVNLLDRDLVNSYLGSADLTEVDFSERQVALSELPEEVLPGESFEFTASQLGLTSQGAPQVTEVEAFLYDSEELVGTFEVDANRTATGTVEVPEDAVEGDAVVLATADTLLGSVEVGAGAPEPGSIGTYQNVRAAYPYRYGGVGKPKRLAVWYGGRDGERTAGQVLVTTRQLGSSASITTSYWYNGFGRNVWTPWFSQRGSHQVTVTFVPQNPAYQSVSHSYWIWVSAS